MKNIKYIVGILLVFCFQVFAQTRIPKKNIEKFLLSANTSTIDNSDSLRVSVFMQIPYNTVQFVKHDTKYIAHYEAVIAVQTKKGSQLGSEVWQDSIIVDEYNHTMSTSKNRTLMVSYKIPHGKYQIMGTLSDLDTKKVGKNSVAVDASKYRNKRYLHTPILLEKFDGNWGFGEDLIPAINNQSFDIENGLLFYISGKVPDGTYQLRNQYLNKQDELLFEEVIEDSTNNGFFKHIVQLPQDKIKGIKIKLRAEFFQKNEAIDKTVTVVLKKSGISKLVVDIDDALDQMRYILSSKERKKIKKTSIAKNEELFRDLWKKRDPTPETTANELMDEYYRRVNYANTHFGGFMEGWETDMGMVYIILGPPDDIEKYIDHQYQKPYESWYYYRIQENYIFLGDNFGNYSLLTPFFGYRR